ncbi:hypothetical protein KEM54_003591 [Ascosphaera aggregata]|nr:hypothetical protein KEM54_003591 [Ascosphaera aggregata]
MGCWVVLFFSLLISSYTRRHATAPLLSNDAPYEDDERSLPDERVAAGTGSTSSSTLLAKPQEEYGDREPLRGMKIILLALPACCDIAGTTLMNVGFLFVVASIYQMTRGALVLFVGVFSVVFLHRRVYAYQWLALLTVVVGVGLVGLAGALAKHNPLEPSPRDLDSLIQGTARAVVERTQDAYAAASTPEALRITVGVMFIAGAQIFTASQFVVEEWILERYAMTPLKVVAWEGVFGFSVTLIGMMVMHLLVGRTETGRNGYFDAVEGWGAMTEHPSVMWSSFAIMLSIGATFRSIIDTCRTLFIWMISLALGWESFKWLQVVGFAMLVYGTFLFHGIVRPPLKRLLLPEEDQEHEVLLPEEPIEHI